MEADKSLHAIDDELVERAQHPAARVLAVDSVHDQLRDHRVVQRGDLAACDDAGVDAHAGARRLVIRRDRSGCREEAVAHVLGIDAALDGVPVEPHVLLSQRQRLARRDEHLLADEVEAGDHLRDRVLDLDARVHLEEEVLALARQQPLDRSRALIADSARGVDGDGADALAQGVVDRGRGRLLDELLVPALDRAVALAEVDDVAVRVGEDLHLDVTRILEVALDVDRRI